MASNEIVESPCDFFEVTTPLDKINEEEEYLDHWDNITTINDENIEEKTLTSPTESQLWSYGCYYFQEIMFTHLIIVDNYILIYINVAIFQIGCIVLLKRWPN